MQHAYTTTAVRDAAPTWTLIILLVLLAIVGESVGV